MDLTEYSTRNSIGCTSIKPIQSKHKSKNEVSSNILETVQEQSENEEDFESMTQYLKSNKYSINITQSNLTSTKDYTSTVHNKSLQ